jgi:hypothetical protein
MQVEQQNRRVFERFSARFPAKFQHSHKDYGTEVFLRDASAQGLRMTSKERVFLHDSLSLIVKLPDGHDPMVLKGHVVWTKSRGSDLWEVGIELHKIELMAMQRLFNMVQDKE